MIISLIKKPLRFVRDSYLAMKIEKELVRLLKDRETPQINNFNFEAFKTRTSQFLTSLQTDHSGIRYRYSSSCSKSTLYASAYSCMALSLLGYLQDYSDEEKREWADYFDSFQRSEDGLFYDQAVMNDLYPESDWWGARHLTLHMISAYTDLGARPKYPFAFLNKYYNTGCIKSWLDAFDWRGASLGMSDIDNKIMNIGCLLQYQRDYWNDHEAADAIAFLKNYLREKINSETGMWGGFEAANAYQRSHMVQFAYHLLPLFTYDKDFEFDYEKIVSLVLKTQNKFGGYGVKLNSSACEDIDSIDILIRFSPYVSENLREKINKSLINALKWVLLNQVDDKGFVFRLAEPFVYGSNQTSSLTNNGAMLPTWFRLLSIAYLTRHLSIPQNFVITTCPGYEIQ